VLFVGLIKTHQRPDTEPSIEITHEKKLTETLEISGIYDFLFLSLDRRKIREPSPCGLSTGH
jgi:hypothetical protein